MAVATLNTIDADLQAVISNLKILHADMVAINTSLQTAIALLRTISTASSITVYTPEHG